MARIFTPSERTRRNTNPQPVNTFNDSISRSRYLVVLKNILGSPIPLLWPILILSLFAAQEVHTWIAFAIAFLSCFYICIDLFSRSKELQFFRLGIEIPFLLLLLSLGLNNWSNARPFFEGDFSLFLLWGFLLYLFSYSLSLFPGLNRIFLVFLFGGAIYCLFGIWQGTQYEHFFWGSEGPSLIPNYDITSTSLVPSIHGAFGAILSIFCVVFFVFKKRLLSISSLGMAILLGLSLYALYTSKMSLFYVAPTLPLLYFLFFLSKKFFRDLILFALISCSGLWAFFSLPENIQKEIIPPNLSSELEKDYWRQEFESIEGQIWLGKSSDIHVLSFPVLEHERDLLQNKSADSDNESYLSDYLFELNSNLYLYLITHKGILCFLAYMLFHVTVILINLKLLNDIPVTHHWHKVFALFLLCSQVFFAIASMNLRLWYSPQLSILFAILCACGFYMSESYLKQIIPDDQSL